MTNSFKLRAARRTANYLAARARELRRDLRDHYRSEAFRIREAEKRARGLRLYVAWSRRCSATQALDREFNLPWHPALSDA